MGKPRKEQPEAESIFANNPFIEGLFEWMDSPEGQQSIAVRDVLWDLLEERQVDAKQRQLIWPEQNVQREKNGLISINPFSASRKCARNSPAARSRSSYLTGSIWATIRKTTPRPSLTNSTSLTERWVADHRRKAKTSKKTQENSSLLGK